MKTMMMKIEMEWSETISNSFVFLSFLREASTNSNDFFYFFRGGGWGWDHFRCKKLSDIYFSLFGKSKKKTSELVDGGFPYEGKFYLERGEKWSLFSKLPQISGNCCLERKVNISWWSCVSPNLFSFSGNCVRHVLVPNLNYVQFYER